MRISRIRLTDSLLATGIIEELKTVLLQVNQTILCNPFFLDSESGFDWTVNPEITGHCFSPILPAVSRGFKCPIQVFFDSSFRIESPFIENVI